MRDRSIMELLDAVAVRRADGRRIEQEEYQALAGILREARTVRSEEIIHALRTPLTTIKGCAATALRPSSVLHPSELQRFFRIIDAQADQLSALINDLMDAAHIVTGSLSLAGPPEPFEMNELVIVYDERRVVFKGRWLKLTAIEYDLLRFLSTNAGKAVTYDQILRNVWRSQNTGDARVVRTMVTKLRRKLGDSVKCPRYIFTESRVGYRMARPGEALRPDDAP